MRAGAHSGSSLFCAGVFLRLFPGGKKHIGSKHSSQFEKHERSLDAYLRTNCSVFLQLRELGHACISEI